MYWAEDNNTNLMDLKLRVHWGKTENMNFNEP